VLALDQIYVAHWAYIDKILKTYIAESHSFDLKIDPLCLLWLPDSDKSVREPSLIDLLLHFLAIRNKVDALGFL
jgi:hypothetical protein